MPKWHSFILNLSLIKYGFVLLWVYSKICPFFIAACLYWLSVVINGQFEWPYQYNWEQLVVNIDKCMYPWICSSAKNAKFDSNGINCLVFSVQGAPRKWSEGFRHVTLQFKNTSEMSNFDTKNLSKFEQFQSGIRSPKTRASFAEV